MPQGPAKPRLGPVGRGLPGAPCLDLRSVRRQSQVHSRLLCRQCNTQNTCSLASARPLGGRSFHAGDPRPQPTNKRLSRARVRFPARGRVALPARKINRTKSLR